MKPEDLTTGGLSLMGLSVTLTDFRNWLDIVLIVLSIINISIILIIKLRRYLKDGKLDKDEISDMMDDYKRIQNELNKLKNDGIDIALIKDNSTIGNASEKKVEKNENDVKNRAEEIKEKYGFDANAIVNMAEVTEYLYNKPYKGQVYIDDTLKAAIDAYYEQYGAK